MLQAPLFECFSFDPLPFQQDGLATPEVNVCGREIVDALVVSLMIVMIDERLNLRFQVGRKEVGLASQKWRAPTETGGVLWGEESGLRRSSSARRCA